MAWQAALVPLIILTIAAVPAVFMGWILPPLQAQSREPFRMSLLVGHFQDLRTLWSDLPLRHGSFGVAFFWGFAAFINLWSLKLARELTQGGEGFGSISSLFMASASIGMAAGFGAASVLQRRRIQLGWVPISSIMMFVCALVLCAIPYGTAEGYKILIGLAEPVAGRSSMQEYVFLGTLLCLAFSSALFLAPLNAWMQDRYPADKRGEMQSAVNLQDCLAGIFAVLVIAGVSLVCEKLHLSGLASVRWQVLVVSLLCLVATIQALRMLTAEFLRVIVLPWVRLIYKIRVVGREHLPDKGGVLLLPNHVTWADSFFLSAACHRPIRFVMYDGFMTAKGVGWFARLFDTVPISSTKAKDAIRVVADALNEGHVVCLFGEGELTRTGCLQEIKRGFELMVRKAGTPVVPVWMDGAWGSIFSFERGKFFKKTPYRLPYPMTLVFESPILASDANAESVRSAMLRGSSRALRVRAEATGLMERKNQEQWVNGLQLGQVNALQRGQEFALWSGDALSPQLGAVSTAFASLFSCKVLSDEKDLLSTAVRVGGSATHARLCAAGANAVPGVFYDFSNESLDGLPAQILHCRCLLRDGVVLAMSMPNPPRGAATSPEQWGLREGTVGPLIPGFAATCEDGGLRFTGPAIAGDGGIFLPESNMDELGFIKIEAKQ
jgi:acyl-[acyl-carrier-protein]-phospholipid O-acyltransferase/long-chain-fatty-acid--[acyl-carrier-protein] ligase